MRLSSAAFPRFHATDSFTGTQRIAGLAQEAEKPNCSSNSRRDSNWLIVCLRRRNQPEEHGALRRINRHSDAAGSTAGIIAPIIADTDVDAVGLRLQLERVPSRGRARPNRLAPQ